MYIHICLYACMHVCMYMYVYVCIRENLTLSGNVRPMAYGDDSPKNIRTWWFHHSPSFIIYPLWNIWKSVRMIIPNIWKNSFKKCSKPPTSNCLVIIIYPSTLYDDEIYVYTYYIYIHIYTNMSLEDHSPFFERHLVAKPEFCDVEDLPHRWHGLYRISLLICFM